MSLDKIVLPQFTTRYTTGDSTIFIPVDVHVGSPAVLIRGIRLSLNMIIAYLIGVEYIGRSHMAAGAALDSIVYNRAAIGSPAVFRSGRSVLRIFCTLRNQ
jgi:hypothetical protein